MMKWNGGNARRSIGTIVLAWTFGLLLATSQGLSQTAPSATDAAGADAKEITDSIGLRLVWVPAGEFTMGREESAEHLVEAFAAYKRKPDFFVDEAPAHRVRITKPFYLGRCEVTVGQFREFVAATGYQTEAEKDGKGGWGYNAATGHCEGRKVEYNWRHPGFEQSDEHPVVDVTWNDAAAFCDWLSRKEGHTYRLPTEAEWEYACRAGTTTRYQTGDAPDELFKHANVADGRGRTTFPHVQELSVPAGDILHFTMPVGSYPPNKFGLYDMHGNVWEWCADWHDDDYYAQSPVDDPTGPSDGNVKVRRGGAWHSYPLWVRSAFRNWNTPSSRCLSLGFRVARNVADTKNTDSPVTEPGPAVESAMPSSSTSAEETVSSAAHSEKEASVSVVFAGDVMLDGGPGHAVVHGTDPFAEFASIFRDADIAVCNLECTIAKEGTQVLKPYAFCGPVEAIPLLKRHFSAVSIANNHSGDFGKDGLSEELSLLEAAKLPWFGGGHNCEEAHRPLVLERNGLRIALLGYNDFPPHAFEAGHDQPGTAWLVEKDMVVDIQTARSQYHADLVIPYLHWGNEDHPEPDADQRALARRLIDAGANAIVGSHPHVIETVDIYKGRPIIYSLGNFVFDYFPVDPPKWIGWIVRLDFKASGQCDLATNVFEIDPSGIPHLLPLPEKEGK